jgi:hypothetical protein
MNTNRRDVLARVLVAAAPWADWTAGGVDRGLELADIFLSWGIEDPTKLSLVQVPYECDYDENVPGTGDGEGNFVTRRIPQTCLGLGFKYQNRSFGWLGTPDDKNNNSSSFFQETMFAWSARGHGNVGYHVRPAEGGFEIFPLWGSSSDWGDFRDFARFAVSIGVGFVAPAIGFNAGASLGAAIVGDSVAVAYPALSTAVGNVAISTALNGGDIERAVKSTALSYVGTQAGGFVGAEVTDATGLDTLGKTAAVATRAFVTGADPRFAIANVLIQSGASMLSTPDFYDPVSMAPDMLPIPDVEIQDNAWLDDTPIYGVELPYDPAWQPSDTDPFAVDYSTPPAGGLFPIPGIVPGENSLFAGSGNIIGQVTAAASSALQLVAAYQKARGPIQATARRVMSNGAVQVANRDGLIHTRNAQGQVTKRRPPVGEATATIDNSLIVNNGDGTYTLISPNGAISTQRYPFTSPVGDINLNSLASPENLKYAALAVGAFFLVKKIAK